MEIRTRFQLIDVCLSAFLFTPLVVLFWHGFFCLLDVTILKDNPIIGPYIIMAVGITFQIVFSCLQTNVMEFIAKKSLKEQRRYMVGYNFMLAMIQILHFRGLNDIYEYFVGTGVYDAVTATCTSAVIMFSMRVCSQVTDMPFTLSLDSEVTVKDGFLITSYYQSNPGFHWVHLIDAIGTIAVIESTVNMFNIAAWIAVDSSFYPSNPFIAMSLSWILGHGLTLIIFYFMPYFKELSLQAVQSETPIVGTIFMDLLSIVQGLGVVMSWHGHFVLYDVLKEYFPIVHVGYDCTALYEVLVAVTLLALSDISSVLVRRGISHDTHENSVNSLKFDANYFAHFFNEEIIVAEKTNKARKSSVEEGNDVNRNRLKESGKKNALSHDGRPRLRKQVSLQDLVEIDTNKSQVKQKLN